MSGKLSNYGSYLSDCINHERSWSLNPNNPLAIQGERWTANGETIQSSVYAEFPIAAAKPTLETSWRHSQRTGDTVRGLYRQSKRTLETRRKEHVHLHGCLTQEK